MLKELRKPDLITITRSQEYFGKGMETYVDPKLVNKVEKRFLESLVKLYGENRPIFEHRGTKTGE